MVDQFEWLLDETPFPALYITYEFWVMLHMQSWPLALLFAYFGESAESLLLAICGDTCERYFGDPEPATQLLIGDILNRSIGVVLLGVTFKRLFHAPPLIPTISWMKRSNWFTLFKYTAQVWSVRTIGLFIDKTADFAGVSDFPVGHLAYTLSTLFLPILFYYWNVRDHRPHIPDELYYRTYILAGCTMGAFNAFYLLDFLNSYLMGFVLALAFFILFIIAYYAFVRKHDSRFIVHAPMHKKMLGSTLVTGAASYFVPYFLFDTNNAPHIQVDISQVGAIQWRDNMPPPPPHLYIDHSSPSSSLGGVLTAREAVERARHARRQRTNACTVEK